MKKIYQISEDNKRNAVKACARLLMRNHKGWKKDKNLDLLEFQIEGILIKYLSGYGGINFE